VRVLTILVRIVAYRDFYRWRALWRAAATRDAVGDRLRHLAYAGGSKKFERVWDTLIRARQVLHALPLLETALTSFGTRRPARGTAESRPGRVPVGEVVGPPG